MSFPPRYRTPRARSRVEAAGAESRAKAVRAAVELFSTAGYRGTSIALVAEKSELSQSGLLHHFPNKAALLAAVLEHRETEDSQFLSGPDDRAPLGWAAFDALTGLVARNSNRPELVGLFVQLSAEATEPGHPAHAWLRDHYTSTRSWLTDAIRDGQDRGEIHPAAPVASLVHLTVAVLDGLQQQWLLDPGGFDMVGEFTTFVSGLHAQWDTTPTTSDTA
ncbi:AcrR family transcriptional regulator [Streptomyces sp. LBL]|uniref:TetR/AcrR family transcriptional regulator n=1 Tax=Streptomyces sp. LBL TaxID=2940562 RepID=UPI002474E67D|nr:TetR/AcrR family transcriptional regulator [Streptomyces sp. LBL]MDH6624100.1 AcrR family transcriptional regulator [Streptomyces sp. LBL]